MLVAPAATAALVVVDWTPGDSAIGGRPLTPLTGPYAVPLFGGAVFQLPSRLTGAVAVTLGRPVMSAAVSERRILRLALLNNRSLNRIEAGSSPTAGRLMRSWFVPPTPAAVSGNFNFLAPVALFRR